MESEGGGVAKFIDTMTAVMCVVGMMTGAVSTTTGDVCMTSHEVNQLSDRRCRHKTAAGAGIKLRQCQESCEPGQRAGGRAQPQTHRVRHRRLSTLNQAAEPGV